MKTIKQISLFVILIILSLNIIQSQQYWQRVQSPTSKWLYRCTYADSSNIWAAGDSGVIVHTSNGGINWVVQNSGIDKFIEDIFFLNPRLGWAISNDYLSHGTLILRTTNGGQNWSSSYFTDSTAVISTVFFVDSLNGYYGGISGLILKTTDAGNNWTRSRLSEDFYQYFPIEKITFFNSQHGLACGGIVDMAGTIWKTSDYGNNWSISDTTTEPLNDIAYYNANLSLATGGDFEFGGSVSSTTNGGVYWEDKFLNVFGTGQSIAIRKLSEIWIPFGFSQYWVCSRDIGATWVSIDTDTNAVYDALFIDTLRGWAFGATGGIYKYVPQLEIGVVNNNLPVSVMLHQNYPNPFNPSTIISYQVLSASKVKIILYDMIGREVKILLNDFKLPGEYNFKVNSDDLASGVYFYKLETASFSDTKKMVIIK